MKFANSVKSSWKSCCSYAKKNYIMTFIMILVIVLIVIYFNKNRVFENYTSEYADAKNRNIDVKFKAISKDSQSYGITLYKVTGISTIEGQYINSYAIDTNKISSIPSNSQALIDGKSGDYGWVIGVTSSTKDYNIEFYFDKPVELSDAVTITPLPITINKNTNKYNYGKNDRGQHITKVNNKTYQLKMNNDSHGAYQLFISFKYI